jgi:hypothetical protein
MSLKDDLLKASKKSIDETNALLADDYNTLIQATKSDLDALRPKVNDQETYDKIIAIVNNATENNLALADVQQRLQSLGAGAVQMAKEVAKLLVF